MKLRIIFAILFITSLAWGDGRIVGHMTPLPNELLDNPITLQCGAVIVEWRGVAPTPKTRQRVNRLCSNARNNFEPFVNRYGYRLQTDSTFYFRVALLPDNTEYRSLNDLQYRFIRRPNQRLVWGYTSLGNKHVYLGSNTMHPEWAGTFTHELFHAMSNYYGVFDQHPGYYPEQCEQEEAMATTFEKEFTP